MAMYQSNDRSRIHPGATASFRDAQGRGPTAGSVRGRADGPIIDQDGREIPDAELRPFPGGAFRFDFGSANPFGNLSRDQCLARLDAMAKLLDVAFILPGTNIRYGIDGIIGLIPVVGDIIAAALSTGPPRPNW